MPLLRDIRVERDISQGDLAKLAGVATPTIVNLEMGRPVWRSSVLKVCEALNVSLSDIEGVNFYSAVKTAAEARKRRKQTSKQ